MTIENVCGWLSIFFLASVSVPDFRSRRIPLILPFLFGAAGACVQLVLWHSGKMNLQGVVIGLLPGIMTAVLASCTDSVGMGDAVCLFVLALFESSLAAGIFAGGLFLMSGVGIILLVSRRAGRKARLPFMPFLFASQMICCALRWRNYI